MPSYYLGVTRAGGDPGIEPHPQLAPNAPQCCSGRLHLLFALSPSSILICSLHPKTPNLAAHGSARPRVS